jgi:NADPH2:quinone reductase
MYACSIPKLKSRPNSPTQQPPLPWIGGFEFSGVVASIPSTGITRFKKGQRIFGAAQGAYATRVCALDSELQPIPDGWGFEPAAGLYLTGPTSYAALKLRADVQKGETVVAHLLGEYRY